MIEEKKKRRITVRSSKNKGKNFQNKICEKIAKLTGEVFDNQDDNAPIQSRQMGQAGVDVLLRGRALELFNYSCECKAGESIGIWKAIRQAKNNQKKESNWLLFLKKKEFKSSFVLLETDIFFDILKQLLIAQETALRGHTDNQNNKPI
jgi:hypothetical protein